MFEVENIIYNTGTKEIFEIIGYLPEIEYGIHHIYEIKNLENNNVEKCNLAWLNQYMTTYEKLEELIKNNNKIIQKSVDLVASSRWHQEEIRYKLKRVGLEERIIKR